MYITSLASKNLKGFTFSEIVITMAVLAIFLAVTIPMFTVQKNFTGMDKDAYTCVVKEGATNLNSTACVAALNKCERNKGNACNSLLSLISSYSDPALTVIGKACTDGGKRACSILVNRCIDDSSTCDVASKTYDIHNYLALAATDTSTGKVLMYNLLKEKMSLGLSNIYNEVIADCNADSTSMACTLLSHKLYDFNAEDEQDFIEQASEVGTVFKTSNAQIVSSAIPSVLAGYGWGANGWGQIGNGVTSGGNSNFSPLAVSGGIAFSQISSGQIHSCGLEKDTGKVYCWGDNGSGKLGDGTTTQRLVPTLVNGGTPLFSKISNGYSHTCGIAADNKAYCWGYGGDGEMGNGSSNMTNATPVQVSVVSAFSEISAGKYFTCGIDKATDYAYCWGYNGLGQLGDNTTTNRSSPVKVVGTDGTAANALHFSKIAASKQAYFACGIERDSKKAYCWGDNNLGELGNGTSGNATNKPIQVSGAVNFTDIDSGGYHTCGIEETSGYVYCWGMQGADGRLGNNSTSTSLVPVAVKDVSGNLPGFSYSKISVGTYQTCGVTLSGAGYCWGDNQYGKLGIGGGSTAPKLIPTLLSGYGFSLIDTGWDTTVGLVSSYVYYITTSDTNQIKNIQSKIIKATITQTTPANTNIKYLVSFDGRATWYMYNGSAWVLVNTSGGLSTVSGSGSAAAQIQSGLNNFTLPSGSTTLDIAAFLSTSNPSIATPLLDKIDIWYY